MHLQVDLHYVPLFMDWILKIREMQLNAVMVGRERFAILYNTMDHRSQYLVVR